MSLLSITFGLFLAVSAAGYYLLPQKLQPRWLLAVSLFYYLCSDWRYLPFLLGCAMTVWLAGLVLEQDPDRPVMAPLVLANIALLFAVKWLPKLAPALPPLPQVLGISFYTLQAISYLSDLRRGKCRAQRDFLHLLLWLCWFPCILQGPICRASDTMEQLTGTHRFAPERIAAGLRLILWGLFRKMIIADRVALLVAHVFNNWQYLPSVTVLLGGAAYALQLYTDFSGCVDICRGASALFGIELPINFARPYGADSIKEFWRRWHMTLSGWLRDHVYIPLGGSRAGTLKKYRNLMATFLVSGLWHGAGPQFLAWGLLHGGYQVAGDMTRPLRDRLWNRAGPLARLRPPVAKVITFGLVCIGWILFRANGLRAGLGMLWRIGPGWLPGSLSFPGLETPDLWVLAAGMAVLALESKLPLPRSKALRTLLALAGILAVAIFGMYGPGFSAGQFLYMDF